MNISRGWTVNALLLVATVVCAMAGPVRADELKIAICNPLKAVLKSNEYKDFQEKTKADAALYDSNRMDKESKLKGLQDNLKLTVPGSPQYEKLSDEYSDAKIDYEDWRRITEERLTNKQKQNIKALFDKVSAATADVAQKNGFNLVIVDKHPDIPDDLSNIEVAQIEAAILQQSILYADAKLDITDQVILAMNNDYAAKH